MACSVHSINRKVSKPSLILSLIFLPSTQTEMETMIQNELTVIGSVSVVWLLFVFQVRYTMKYTHSKGCLSVKLTDDVDVS
jgi:hypothetical protein